MTKREAAFDRQARTHRESILAAWASGNAQWIAESVGVSRTAVVRVLAPYLTERGWEAPQIAARLGVSSRTVCRARALARTSEQAAA